MTTNSVVIAVTPSIHPVMDIRLVAAVSRGLARSAQFSDDNRASEHSVRSAAPTARLSDDRLAYLGISLLCFVVTYHFR